MAATPAIFALDELRITYPGPRSGGILGGKTLFVKAVDGVSCEVREGETLGLVGESGCGKSTIALGALRLVRADGGRVLFDGADVLKMSQAELRGFRREAQIVFQDPYSSLHPRKRVGKILAEPLELHTRLSRHERRREVGRLLEQVGMPAGFAKRYARDLSGGQRQRVAIARALALRPRLLILDEPVSALDVSIRAQIIALLQDLQKEFGLTYIFISHDLALVRSLCDSVAVMYLGKIVESGQTGDVFAAPAHPYTRVLLSAIPVPDPELEATRPRIKITGEIPTAVNPPSGCRFHPRCPWKRDVCVDIEPQLVPSGDSTQAACHFWPDVKSQPVGLGSNGGAAMETGGERP